MTKVSEVKFIDVLAWNVYIGNTADEVRDNLEPLLNNYGPEVAVLMEATRMKGHLGGFGYQVIQLKPRPLRPGSQAGQANIAILVRNDLVVKRRRALHMKTFWKGPKHGWSQDPRVYRSVKVEWRGVTWKIAGAHTPFGEDARTESRNRLVAWLKRTISPRPAILVLDANMGLREFDTTIAKPGGAQAGGVGIDLIAVKNSHIGAVRDLGKHGSDHPAMLYRVVK